MFSLFWGFLIDRTCFLCVLLMVKLLRGWEFDEINRKPSPTEKRNSYRVSWPTLWPRWEGAGGPFLQMAPRIRRYSSKIEGTKKALTVKIGLLSMEILLFILYIEPEKN